MKNKIRFFNMYVTIYFSVTIVLFFIGLFCFIILSSHNFIDTVKSKASFIVVLKADTDTLLRERFENLMNVSSYCFRYSYLSKDAVLTDYKNSFDDDPYEILGYNPFHDSYEIFLKPAFVHPDSIKTIVSNLNKLPYVDRVAVNDEVFTLFGDSFNRLLLIVLGIVVVLFLISEVLIINTIRLQVYSKRFIISTMKLVGATAWKIKKPFLKTTFAIGFFAFLLTGGLLSGLFFYCKTYLGIILFPLSVYNISFVVAVIFFASIFMTTITSFFACDRYIRLKSNTMYEI